MRPGVLERGRSVVQDLLDEGVPVEGVRRSRKAIALVVPSSAHSYVAAMNLGDNHVAVAVADTTGRSVAERWSDVDVDGQAEGAVGRQVGEMGR